MKHIENKTVVLDGRARHFAVVVGAAVVDTEGAYTTVAHFLCGENPWGFHNDLRFSLPPGDVRQGLRVMAAAERALKHDEEVITLSNEDYEVLMSAVSNPKRHPTEMRIPTPLARAIVPLLDVLENAVDDAEIQQEGSPTERVPPPDSEHPVSPLT